MILYGTWDAAMNWQEKVAKEMPRWGFKQGRYNPCLYWNAKTGLMTLLHSDDFVSVGPKGSARQFHDQIREKFEIKKHDTGAPKPDGSASAPSGQGNSAHHGVQEGRVSNRVVKWTPEGWEVEPDERYVDLIIRELGLGDARPASTPCENERSNDEKSNCKL